MDERVENLLFPAVEGSQEDLDFLQDRKPLEDREKRECISIAMTFMPVA